MKNLTKEPQTYRANGKFLISGEYLVLHGANALAVPLTKGQTMQISKRDDDYFTWSAFHDTGLWFSAIFNNQLDLISNTNETLGNRLKEILLHAIRLAGIKKSDLMGNSVETRLEFDPEWGMGSSSTLIHNIAQFFKIDPYLLLDTTFSGSGYDLACARSNSPIYFSKLRNTQEIVKAPFNPTFADKLLFIYTGSKKNSESDVLKFSRAKVPQSMINDINMITQSMSTSQNEHNFALLMRQHEEIIASFLKEIPIQQKSFNDFDGQIKSLGAWGGDFILAIGKNQITKTKEYFRTKGLKVMFKYSDIVLNNP